MSNDMDSIGRFVIDSIPAAGDSRNVNSKNVNPLSANDGERRMGNSMNYNLLVVDEQRTLSALARDRADALGVFGRELGVELTQDGGDAVAPYLMDEWAESPHWVNPTIPVFAKGVGG